MTAHRLAVLLFGLGVLVATFGALTLGYRIAGLPRPVALYVAALTLAGIGIASLQHLCRPRG